ncbi:MAG: long-chain fatty acid--CoA ligase, partial [Comamonadaceae bacterium]
MRAPPTTFEIFEELALSAPRQPALRDPDGVLDYGQLHAVLVQCGLALQRLGVRRGQRVAISGPGFGLQLALLLAAESLGATTASFQAENDSDAPFLFRQVDWVFSGVPQQVPEGVRFHLTDQAFASQLARPLGAERPAWSPLALHEPQRITRTSGSSGRSKFIVLSRGAQEQWLANGTEKRTYLPGARLLVLGPFVMNAALVRSSTCLRRGAMVIGPDTGLSVPDLDPTHIWGLPLHLEALLRTLPPGWVSPHPVDVALVGGAMSERLRADAARVFGGWIKNRYGSNETGGICEEIDADGVGLLCAGTEVRILGPQGEDLPAGETGTIALRTAMMADGYLGLPEENAAAFRDGWFISNDVGAMVGHRRLRLLGRRDDLVNIGGIKVAASQIEARIAAQPGIADCVLQAVHLDGGAVTLGVALVPAPGTSAAEATVAMRDAMQLPADVT